MKFFDLVILLSAINNKWAFAAFLVIIAVWLYFERQDAP